MAVHGADWKEEAEAALTLNSPPQMKKKQLDLNYDKKKKLAQEREIKIQIPANYTEDSLKLLEFFL